jgi:nucleoside phosphorylase
MSKSHGPKGSEAYTVAWIAALPHERAAGEAMFDEEYEESPEDFKKSRGDINAYSWGKIGKHYVVVAALPDGEYGLTATAIVAQSLQQSLPHIRIGLLVGIGAGIREVLDKSGKTVRSRDIRLGDIAVSSQEGTTGGVVQFDFVKAKLVDGEETLERKGMLNNTPFPLRTALAMLKARHIRKGSRIAAVIGRALEENPAMQADFRNPGVEWPDSEIKTDVYHARDGKDILSEVREIPKVHYGIIASSNTLEKSAQHRDAVLARLAKENIHPVCFEMEAAGLMNNFPCLVIRGICDYGNEYKNDNWQNYAAVTAAAFGKELLECVDVAEVQETQEIGKLVLQKSESLIIRMA